MRTKLIIDKFYCSFCKKIFLRYIKWINGKNHFCSIKCKSTYQKTQKGKRANKTICLICNKEYFVRPSQQNRRKTCSKKCFSILLSRKIGELHPRWKGGIWLSKKGYIYKGKKLLHRLIMEDNLNQELESYEVVHHINGNKQDNRLENLEVLTRNEHSKLHLLKQI